MGISRLTIHADGLPRPVRSPERQSVAVVVLHSGRVQPVATQQVIGRQFSFWIFGDTMIRRRCFSCIYLTAGCWPLLCHIHWKGN